MTSMSRAQSTTAPAASESGLHLDGPQTMPSQAAGWWETERARFVRSRISALTDKGDIIVDVGCGRGDMLDDSSLADRVRVNVDSHIWDEWRGRDDMLFVAARGGALPFRDGAFDLVGSFDVLEHIPDHVTALGEQNRISGSDASIVAAVPADQRLWSAHDEAVGHQRRYSLATFGELAAEVGLPITRRSYFYSFLWLPAWLTRKSELRTVEPATGEGLVSRAVSGVIGLLAGLERAALKRFTLPFGTSAWFELDARHEEPSATPPQ